MVGRSILRPVRRHWPFVLTILLLWPVVAWAVARALLPAAEECDVAAHAIVVLAGSRAYPERTALAAELFARGAAPRILLTHDGLRGKYLHSQERNPWMVERAAWELQKHGVPVSQMEILLEQVSSTREEAALLHRYAVRHEVSSLLVVTSGYHVRRARWTFERAFAGAETQVHFCGVSPEGTRLAPARWWLSLAGWDAVAGEYVRRVAYRVLY